MARIRSNRGSQVQPSKVMQSGNSQQSVTAAAAQKYGLSPQTLWGVYGTETSFGADLSTSSAGAQGYMQFEPETAKQYGVNPNSFTSSMFGAAHYLHDLGADSNPNSAATRKALNGYNGNGGGAAVTSYVANVQKLGTQFGGASPSDMADPNQAGGSGGGGGGTQNVSSGGGGDPLTILTDLLTLNLSDLASQLALASLGAVKDIAVGLADYIIAPSWHWNQRAVAYYTQQALDPRKFGSAGEYQWAFGWTAVLWGFGYVILWTEPGGGLKSVPVSRSRGARHVRRLQAVPARRSLTRPKDVARNTPGKPKPRVSSASITQGGMMTVARTRPVRVEGTQNGRERPVTTETGLSERGTIPPHQSRTHGGHPAEPHPEHNSGQGTHQAGRADPQKHPAQGS